MSITDLLGDDGLENDLLLSDGEADDEDLLHLLDCQDDDDESLSGSVVALLESESLGSLKELLKSEKTGIETKEALKPCPRSKSSGRTKQKKTIKLVRKRCLAPERKETTNKASSESPSVATAPKCVEENDVFVIDTKPHKSLDEVSDLREYLNQKKRKIFLGTEEFDSKLPHLKSGQCSPSLFPTLPRGIILEEDILNTFSANQQFSFHHLSSPSKFSLDHL